ncbi:transposase [Bacillus pseudomycoides]|nr:transposase [Bacillus pseudomycoides]PFX46548.1 transposase [Bacillus pseudomycoides]
MYKCEKIGGLLVKVAPAYTSQDCSSCGNRVKKSLSIRTHICTTCGTVLDRDHNASLNILRKGLEQLLVRTTEE